MKKRIGLLFLLVITFGLCVILGFEAIPKINKLKDNKVEESVVESNVQSTLSGKISAVVEKTNPENSSQIEESLSAEDKAVKSEISKHSNTKVDFRYNKQEIIQDKKINMTFSELDQTFDNKKIEYKNAENDTFVYELDSGKLFYARIRNAIVTKTEESIDVETAKKIATDYILEKCNLDGYTLWLCEESEEGYMFVYSKYYGEYRTDESFGVGVGFNGSIFYIRDNTNLFAGIELNINDDWINQKINEILYEYKDTNAEVVDENTYITIENGKPCLFIAVQYGVSPDGKTGAYLAIHTVPIS